MKKLLLATVATAASANTAVVPATMRQEVFYLSPNAGASALAGKGCHGKPFNVTWQNDKLQAAADACAKGPRYKTSCLIAPGSPAGQDALTGDKRHYQKEPAGDVFAHSGDRDLAGKIAQIRARGAVSREI